jgi:ribosomal protein L4
MNVDVVNMEGKKIKSVELPKSIFEAKIDIDLMHQAFERPPGNARYQDP